MQGRRGLDTDPELASTSGDAEGLAARLHRVEIEESTLDHGDDADGHLFREDPPADVSAEQIHHLMVVMIRRVSYTS
jgi:hypothetical protein